MWFIPFELNGIGIRSDPDGKRTRPLKETLFSAGAHGVSAIRLLTILIQKLFIYYVF